MVEDRKSKTRLRSILVKYKTKLLYLLYFTIKPKCWNFLTRAGFVDGVLLESTVEEPSLPPHPLAPPGPSSFYFCPLSSGKELSFQETLFLYFIMSRE